MITGTLGHTNFKLGMLFETIEGGKALKYEGLSPNYCQMRGTKGGDYSQRSTSAKDHMISGTLGYTNFKLGMLFETTSGEKL